MSPPYTHPKYRPRKRRRPIPPWDWSSDLVGLITASVCIYALTLLTLYTIFHP